LNKYTEDYLIAGAEAQDANIFAISERISNENSLKKVFEIAKSHSEETHDLAISVTERMKSSAVVLSDYSAQPVKAHQTAHKGGRWAKATRMSTSANHDIEVLKYVTYSFSQSSNRWQLAKEDEEHQKELEKEKFAKKKLSFNQFFDLYSNVTDGADILQSKGSSGGSSHRNSRTGMTRETFLSNSSRSGSSNLLKSARGSIAPMMSKRSSAVPIIAIGNVLMSSARGSAKASIVKSGGGRGFYEVLE
jgi:hypothetical protein